MKKVDFVFVSTITLVLLVVAWGIDSHQSESYMMFGWIWIVVFNIHFGFGLGFLNRRKKKFDC